MERGRDQMIEQEFTERKTSRQDSTAPLNTPIAIRVIGAKTHNLKQIDVDIPLGRISVITGVSGSGKSSLAFDTIFAEGRHRYLASVSTQSRELLQNVDRPEVEMIDGLPPVLSLERKLWGSKKRSTVATTSEIYDYLRLLYARLGQLNCPDCHQPVSTQSRAQIVEQVLALQDRQKVIVLAPIVRGQLGSHTEVFGRIVKDGYIRARVDGDIIDASTPPDLARTKPHNIEIVVDRLVIKNGIQSRLEESIDLALQLGQGQCVISREAEGTWYDRLYSSRLVCLTCGTSFPTLEPRSFSFNSPAGACKNCEGTGLITATGGLDKVCDACRGKRLNPVSQSVLINQTSITDFCGMSPPHALATLENWSQYFKSQSQDKVEPPSDDRTPQASELLLTIPKTDEAISFEESSSNVRKSSQYLVPEIANRLNFLIDVGLDYVTLDRGCETLSAGELQRTRLAACLGSQLTGVCYILDEPTTGLHVSDTLRLLRILRRLRDDGNTLILVEHDLEVIRQADYVIDLGPGAGVQGGHVLATGTPFDLANNPASVTGRFLAANQIHEEQKPFTRPSASSNSQILKLSEATLHNLKNVTLTLPLQQLVCVTGVSGSGKSSLIMQTLVPAVRRALGEKVAPGGSFRELCGMETISKLIQVDQSPLGRSARSSPASYTKVWDEIRQIFAKTRESRQRGLQSRYFSLAFPEARCRRCLGQGVLSVDERRFSDWSYRCPDCNGRRFAPEVLSVRYRNHSVADILEMSLFAAAKFFENFPRLFRTLSVLNDLGLGYLKLGQSAKTLSGGESQRIKLATELAKPAAPDGTTLFILDEPTAGLHGADIQQLTILLQRLVFDGHSVLVIEHHQQLVSSADWIIEIGPGAGPQGGRITSVRKVNDARKVEKRAPLSLRGPENNLSAF